MRSARLPTLLLLACLCLAAPPARAEHDPWEPLNRQVHALNTTLHSRLLGPIATLYTTHTPPLVRAAIGNALANLNEPLSALNHLLAGDTEAAATAATRFALNTTLGLGGIRDVATERGYPRQPTTLGDTLCRWGIPAGPYLVLPVLGPSTLRDATAATLTTLTLGEALGPELLTAWNSTESFHAYSLLHPELQRIEDSSLDPYATLRSAFTQRREAHCPG